MYHKISKNGMILGAFAIVTTALIITSYLLTKDRIEEAKRAQLLSVLNQLVPQENHDNLLYQDCIILAQDSLLGNKQQHAYRARMEGQNVAAIIETTAPDGYSGNIELVVAIDTELNVLGSRVITHRETPGLGDKIDLRVSDWILSFSDVKYDESNQERWRVKKDGGQFDQFTGATITPRAVVRAIANTAEYFKQNQQAIFTRSANCETSEKDTQVDES